MLQAGWLVLFFVPLPCIDYLRSVYRYCSYMFKYDVIYTLFYLQLAYNVIDRVLAPLIVQIDNLFCKKAYDSY